MSVRNPRPIMILLSTIFSCILFMKENGAVELLHKPTLEVLTSDPYMIGDIVQLNCTNWMHADQFHLKKNLIISKTQNNTNFAITDLKSSDSGLYTCSYMWRGVESELSEPEHIYVQDKYPPPNIIVNPRQIVRPGEDITIICDSPYSNIQFTIYKDFKPMKESNDNPFSHVITNVGEKDVGQYVCGFRTKSGSKTQFQSHLSNPIMIQVKDLQGPSVSWKAFANDYIKIICQAPYLIEKKMWFQLLNSSKGIEDEIKEVTEHQVFFNISSPDHSQKKYYCIYAIRVGSSFALSAMSEPVFIWGDDYTVINIIRLLISALVLILLGVILVKHFQEAEERPPKLPPARDLQEAQSEYSEMVIMKADHVVEDSLDTTTPNIYASSDEKVEEL